MATLTDYRGLQVVTPDPTGRGGLAIQNDLKALADRLAASRYVEGLRLAHAGASAVRIEPGHALSDDGTFDLALDAAATVDLTRTGAGGLDAGPEAARTLYYVHLVGDTSGTNPTSGLLSTRPTAPALPTGYDRFRRVGFVVNGDAGDLLRFHQAWNGLTRRYHFAEDESRLRVLTDGGDTAFTAVDCSAFAPRTARLLQFLAVFRNNVQRGFLALFVGNGTARHARFRAAGDVHDGTLYTFRNGVGTTDGLAAPVEVPCDGDQRIEYRVSEAGAALTLAVRGVDDEL